MKEAHGDMKTRHVCENCDDEFLKISGLRKHMQEAHGEMKTRHVCKSFDDEFLDLSGLSKHMKEKHSEKKTRHICETCDDEFLEISGRRKHMKKVHCEIIQEEWNCNDCYFQGNCASELMGHLKVTGHQPSQDNEDKRKIFKDFKQCYTCSMEFDGFYNLMNHRKDVHPSNKKCRNFPDNCQFGNECWYVHDEKMEVDPTPASEENLFNFKCNMCEKIFRDKSNFMKHIKMQHTGSTQTCQKFAKGLCERNASDCWYVHQSEQNKQKSKAKDPVFPQAPSDPFQPDQLSRMFWMVSNLCRKVEGIKKRFEDLMI